MAELMVHQVEFADVVLLNKVDVLREAGEAGRVEERLVRDAIQRLNPTARVVACEFGSAPLHELLNTGRFDLQAAQSSAGWQAELARPAHTPETEEYGVGSLVFRPPSGRPFHPGRLRAILSGFGDVDLSKWGGRAWTGELGERSAQEVDTAAFRGVIRSKGWVWLANAHACCFRWHSAGRTFFVTPTYPQCFLARAIENALGTQSLAEAETGLDRAMLLAEVGRLFGHGSAEVNELTRLRQMGVWDDTYGDRGQRLVLIGVNLDKPRMQSALEGALLTDAELAAGPAAWKRYEDPFFDGDGGCARLFWDVPARA